MVRKDGLDGPHVAGLFVALICFCLACKMFPVCRRKTPLGKVPSKNIQNTASWVCAGIEKSVGEIPMAGMVVNFACDRVKARWRYMELRPILFKLIDTFGQNDKTTKFILDELLETVPYGARRLNFENYYVKGQRLRSLPEDPNDLMYGYW